MPFEYLILLLIAFLPTFLLSFHPRSELSGNRKWIALLCAVLVAVPFWIWDIYATHRGHWDFNEKYILGPKIINLPFEEVLFFLAIPFSCQYLYRVICEYTTWQNLLKKLKNQD
jgi:lycopene cyclase domain-containing protein